MCSLVAPKFPSIWKGACVSQRFFRVEDLNSPSQQSMGNDFHLETGPEVDFIALGPTGTTISTDGLRLHVQLLDIHADPLPNRVPGKSPTRWETDGGGFHCLRCEFAGRLSSYHSLRAFLIDMKGLSLSNLLLLRLPNLGRPSDD